MFFSTKISKTFDFFGQKSKKKLSGFSPCFYMESPSNLLKKAIKKNFSGRVNKQQDAMGSILKLQKVSESFRRCQEASGSIRNA